MIQADSNRSEMSTLQDVKFFIGLLPKLEQRITALVQQLRKPLTYIMPVDFQAHLQRAKSTECIDQEWVETFKDVIALKVEGRINTTLMRLAEQIRIQFGGQNIFWLDILCGFAQNEKYNQNLRIWQINDTFKSCLHLPIGQYEKNRHFRKLAKNDINLAKKLITLINELSSVKQNEESSKKAAQQILGKIQLNYKWHQQSSRKVVQFLKNQKVMCLDFFVQSNFLYPGKRTPCSEVSGSWSKRTKEKDRLNVPKQKMITDFSVQMNDHRNTQLLKKITGQNQKLEDPTKYQQIDRVFGNILEQSGEMKIQMQQLRHQFISGRSKLLTKPQSIYCNIFIAYSYIEFQEFPNLIDICPIKYFNNPFNEFEEINYEINDYELYEEYEADMISEEDSEAESDDDTLDSIEKRQFYNLEDQGYQLDEQDKLVRNTAYRSTKLFEGNPWIFDYRKENPFWVDKKSLQINNHQNYQVSRSQSRSQSTRSQNYFQEMINEFDSRIICPNSIPMPVFLEQKTQNISKEDYTIFKNIFHGRSKKQAMELIKANEQLSEKFSKQKIRDLMSKMIKKRVKISDNKWAVVYFNSDEDQENLLKDQNTGKAAVSMLNNQCESDSELDEPETAAYEQEYRPSKTVKINLSSRSSSQRINNLKGVNSRSQEEKTSQSLSISNKPVSVTGENDKSNVSRRECLRESKMLSSDTVRNPPVSRLRPRGVKPNYNLEQILNGQKGDNDIEI